MAEQIGEYEFQMKNNSFSNEADGTIVANVDFEGTAGDFGPGFGTLRVPLKEPGAKSGVCTWTGQACPPGVPWVTGAGDGTWEQVEDLNRWILVFPVVEISDGSRVRSEGVLDLETRMLKGKMYDAS